MENDVGLTSVLAEPWRSIEAGSRSHLNPLHSTYGESDTLLARTRIRRKARHGPAWTWIAGKLMDHHVRNH
jgi:hypothetical protein